MAEAAASGKELSMANTDALDELPDDIAAAAFRRST
jgi:hypothetical protein